MNCLTSFLETIYEIKSKKSENVNKTGCLKNNLRNSEKILCRFLDKTRALSTTNS